MDTQHHIKKYIEYHNKYTEKYGENTVVLMQAGSHFNLFAIINDEMNIGPDIYHICQNVLSNSLQVTKQNKKKAEISYNNCLLAGFPVYSIQKYENMFLNNNYTVVIVEQITAPPNPERGVTRIVSPGTTVYDYNNNDSRYLMSIYIEKTIYKTKDTFITGISTIDLATGKNYLHYIISRIDDHLLWVDEIGRYIHFYNPSEIIFQLSGFSMAKDEIIQKWDIHHNSIQINQYTDKEYLQTTYQNEFLQKIFNFNIMTHISPIEHLDLEMKPVLVASYIYMLQYIQDHLVDSLVNIAIPEQINDKHCLCLTSNSIRQLNVINNYSYFKGKNESLLSICNLCVTTMGRRLFKERLLYPSLDPIIITKRYDMIDLFLEDGYYEKVHSILRKVSDLEKSLRRMGLKILQPADFFSDTLSFEYVNQFLSVLDNVGRVKEDHIDEIKSFQDFYEECKNTFIFHNLSQFGNLEKSILKLGINNDLDDYSRLTEEYHGYLKKIGERLSQLLDNSENSVKLDFDERNDWFFYCTNKRAITFKQRLINLNSNSIHVKSENNVLVSFKKEDFTFKKKDGSSTIIQFEKCRELSSKLINIQDNIKKRNKMEWGNKIDTLFSKYNGALKKFYYFLSEIDCYCSAAKISIKNGYCRPEIFNEAKKSFIDCKEIRHPIVEKIHTDTEYITNDIELGRDESKDGILLFGTNACGKSTFMKAVGLNLIMAQAGLYVAASSFIYKPYTQIFTRILNNDNIFRSQSSFAVEIHELKSILNRSDKDSLILGDELCSGTETTSALCIISAGLDTLCKRGSSFIFTSHLHELTKIDEVKALNNLKIYHLKIEHDKEKDLLIYDRKLEEGSGPSIYGLKVCEAMGISKDFISFAKSIQNKFMKDTIVPKKKSQYNSCIFMDECKVCHSKEDHLETHHIKDQQYADNDNMIDHHHKNIKHNLVPLCKGCHLKVTNGELTINGWKATNIGKILDWEMNTTKVSSRKKFSEEMITSIIELREKNNNISQKDFLKKIEIENKIQCSVSTFKKIIDQTY